MSKPFLHHRRVEFRDTDAAGIVHFSVFFNYMEEAEHSLLRTLGMSVLSHDAEGPFSWPRVSVWCDYRSPLRFGEEFDVSVHVARLGRSSVTYAFHFTRDGNAVAEGEVVAVCCRLSDGRPQPIPVPEPLAEKLRGLLIP
jgi:acyl-CoA thioester hydrolase